MVKKSLLSSAHEFQVADFVGQNQQHFNSVLNRWKWHNNGYRHIDNKYYIGYRAIDNSTALVLLLLIRKLGDGDSSPR